MKSQEKPEIPVEICPICYNPKAAHAADCDYEKKVEQHNKSEGITPEFEENVRSGKINFDEQMKELKQFWENIKESPAIPTSNEVDPIRSVAESAIRFDDSIRKLKSFDTDLVLRSLENNELASIMRHISELYISIKLYFRELGENRLPEDVNQNIDHLEKMTTDYATLVEEFSEKLKSLNQ